MEAKAKRIAVSGSLVYVIDNAGRVLMLDTDLVADGAGWTVLPALPEVVNEAWDQIRRDEAAVFAAAPRSE